MLIAWDLDGDGRVGIDDFLILIANWGNPYDINAFIDLLANWGPCGSAQAQSLSEEELEQINEALGFVNPETREEIELVLSEKGYDINNDDIQSQDSSVDEKSFIEKIFEFFTGLFG